MRWIASGFKHSLRRDLIIGWLGVENILDEFLWIAIIQRKPCALHLHHNAMSFLERVIVRPEVYRVFVDVVGINRGRLFKALSISAAKNFVGNHQLIARHILFARLIRIDVNQFHYPVAVRSRSRREQMCDYLAADGHILIENIGLP